MNQYKQCVNHRGFQKLWSKSKGIYRSSVFDAQTDAFHRKMWTKWCEVFRSSDDVSNNRSYQSSVRQQEMLKTETENVGQFAKMFGKIQAWLTDRSAKNETEADKPLIRHRRVSFFIVVLCSSWHKSNKTCVAPNENLLLINAQSLCWAPKSGRSSGVWLIVTPRQSDWFYAKLPWSMLVNILLHSGIMYLVQGPSIFVLLPNIYMNRQIKLANDFRLIFEMLHSRSLSQRTHTSIAGNLPLPPISFCVERLNLFI